MKHKPTRLWIASAFLRFAILGILSVVLLTATLGGFWPSMKAVGKTEHSSGPVQLPWSFDEYGAGKVLTIEMQYHLGVPTLWQVIARCCISRDI